MLNSNVALDLKQVSGVPYWKARGADTWNPFNCNVNVKVECFNGAYNSNRSDSIKNSYKKAKLYVIAQIGSGQKYTINGVALTLTNTNQPTYIGYWYESNEVYDIASGSTLAVVGTPSGYGTTAMILVGN